MRWKMKKFIIAAVSFVLLLTAAVPLSAFADEPEDIYSELTEQLDEALAEFDLGIGYDDITEFSFGELMSTLWDRLSARIAAPLRLLSAILLIIVAASVLRTSAGSALGGASGGTYDMVCVMTASAVAAPQLIDVFTDTVAEIELCGGFIIVFVPVFTAVAVACGGVTSARVYHLMILGASEMITELSESYLLPVLGAATALSVTGSVFPDSSLECVVGLLKKASTWSITVVMTLFTGFVTLKCSIAGKAGGQDREDRHFGSCASRRRSCLRRIRHSKGELRGHREHRRSSWHYRYRTASAPEDTGALRLPRSNAPRSGCG